jgi:hypothetical protein
MAKGDDPIYGAHPSLGGSFAEQNVLNRPRQSDQVANKDALGSLNLATALKYANISNNFGISKTQDSKTHSNGGVIGCGGSGSYQNTLTYHSRDNRTADGPQMQVQNQSTSQNTSQIMKELTLMEYMRNNSNENIKD